MRYTPVCKQAYDAVDVVMLNCYKKDKVVIWLNGVVLLLRYELGIIITNKAYGRNG